VERALSRLGRAFSLHALERRHRLLRSYSLALAPVNPNGRTNPQDFRGSWEFLTRVEFDQAVESSEMDVNHDSIKDLLDAFGRRARPWRSSRS
jgi:hypothetical protein